MDCILVGQEVALLKLLPCKIKPRSKVPGKPELTGQYAAWRGITGADRTHHDNGNENDNNQHDKHDEAKVLLRFFALRGLLDLLLGLLAGETAVGHLRRLTREEGFDELLNLLQSATCLQTAWGSHLSAGNADLEEVGVFGGVLLVDATSVATEGLTQHT